MFPFLAEGVKGLARVRAALVPGAVACQLCVVLLITIEIQVLPRKLLLMRPMRGITVRGASAHPGCGKLQAHV